MHLSFLFKSWYTSTQKKCEHVLNTCLIIRTTHVKHMWRYTYFYMCSFYVLNTCVFLYVEHVKSCVIHILHFFCVCPVNISNIIIKQKHTYKNEIKYSIIKININLRIKFLFFDIDASTKQLLQCFVDLPHAIIDRVHIQVQNIKCAYGKET